MLISTVFMWVAIAAALVVSLPCLWMASLSLWPRAAERRASIAARGLGKSLLVGLLPLALTILAVSRLGSGRGAVVLPLLFLLLWGFACADGLAIFVGRSVWPQFGVAAPWKQTMFGGLLLCGSTLLPGVGWVVLLPLIGVLGWGISIRAIFLKDKLSSEMIGTDKDV